MELIILLSTTYLNFNHNMPSTVAGNFTGQISNTYHHPQGFSNMNSGKTEYSPIGELCFVFVMIRTITKYIYIKEPNGYQNNLRSDWSRNYGVNNQGYPQPPITGEAEIF